MLPPTQQLIPSRSILEATFNIFYNSVNGTAFLVKGNKGQYLITAKHIFGNLNLGSQVEVYIKGGIIDKKLNCKIFFHDNPSIDIIVLKLDTALENGDILPLGKAGEYYLGQDCFFLGYPLFNLGTQTGIGKVPFVKRAILSAFHKQENVKLLLLDGHNNPGFSGGPVVTYSETREKSFIFGVISGYYNQSQSVDVMNGELKNQILINENSGIIISYPSEYIQEIIDKIESPKI